MTKISKFQSFLIGKVGLLAGLSPFIYMAILGVMGASGTITIGWLWLSAMFIGIALWGASWGYIYALE